MKSRAREVVLIEKRPPSEVAYDPPFDELFREFPPRSRTEQPAKSLQKPYDKENGPKLDDNDAVDESKTPGYTSGTMETPVAFAAAARTFSDRELKEYVQKGEVAADILREREKTIRANGEPRLKPESSPPEPPPSAIEWPKEKWKGSPEELSRKKLMIVEYLRRVWKPFIEEHKVIVTREILKEVDRGAATALRGYLQYNQFPTDIPFLTSDGLRHNLAARPVTTPLLDMMFSHS